MNKVYINGKFFSEEKAKISVFDRGYLYGEGAFETLRSYNGKPAFIKEHFERIKNNCKQLHIKLPIDFKTFTAALTKVLTVNDIPNAALRVTVSNVGNMSIDRPSKLTQNVVIFARPAPHYSRRLYTEGAKIIVVRSVIGETEIAAQIKSTSYLSRMIARDEVNRAKADEGIVLSARGNILEGTATNIFVVRGEHILTPPIASGVLPGITRMKTIEYAKQLGLSVREAKIMLSQLDTCDEIFMTGTTREIMPIREVVGITKKAKAPGPITQQLLNEYRRQLS